MDITFYEVNEPTDEYRSRVIARFFNKKVADQYAAANQGWYGAACYVSKQSLTISEAETLPPAVREATLNYDEYKQYLALRDRFKHMED